VYFTKINADGTLGSWMTTSSYINSARYGETNYIYHGYLYLAGGYSTTDVQYAQINANGTLGPWRTTNSLSATGGARYAAGVAYNGYLYVLGGSGYSAVTQYAKIDPAGAVRDYTASSSQTSTLNTYPAVVAYNNYLYSMGGYYGGAYVADVRYAPINADGTVGSWINSPNSLTSIAGNAVGLVNDGYLYVLGGFATGSTRLNTVQYASVNSDGSVNAFANTTVLPVAITAGAGVVYNGYMYYLGGQTGPRQSTVYYAPINVDGTVGSWSTTAAMNRINQTMAAVEWNGYMYTFGGANAKTEADTYAAVEYAKINSDGTLGSWTDTSSMQTARYALNGFVSGGYLYAVGGTNSTTDFASVEYAKINSDGSVGSWQYTVPLPDTYTNFGSVYYGGRFYMYNGRYGGAYIKTGLIAQVNNGGTGMLQSFSTNSTNLSGARPSGLAYGGSFAADGYLYVVGGRSASTTYASVYAAPINDDGSIGSWVATTSLNTARSSFGLALQNGYVYVAGGDNSGTSLNSVEYALVKTGGKLGTWQSGGSITNARTNTSTAAYNGYLYVLGGKNGSTYYNDVQYAALSPSTGAVGSWASTRAFATARYGHQAVAYGGYLYVLGGNDGTNYLSDVQSAPLNSDGTVGTWSATSSMNMPRANFVATAANGYLYTSGGVNGSSSLSDVQSAQFGANGQVNNWKRSGGFSTARSGLAGADYNGELYVLGGYSSGGSYLSDEQYTSIDVQDRVGTYSKLIDLGQVSSVSTISYNGNLPGGLSAITYRAAGDDAVFGDMQYFGATTNVTACASDGSGSGFTARYVWLLVTVDGSEGMIYPDSSSNYANVTDLTVSYGPLHAQPNQRLHGGKYFKDEALQPLDTCGA
jgi:hypothetical protein